MNETLEGSCHCGNVHFALAGEPAALVSCNCSMCHRIGALWAHAATGSITVTIQRTPTLAYQHGDRMLTFHSCGDCGCTTHWTNNTQGDDQTMAVNMRCAAPQQIAHIPVRRFDGADTWEFLPD